MIGNLGANARAALWQRLARALAPGAPAIIGLQEPAEAVAVHRTRFAELAVGRLR